MGWFFNNGDENKSVSKDDNVKLKEVREGQSSNYQRITEDGDYHDTEYATRDAYGHYIQGGHNGNLSKSEKRDAGRDFTEKAKDAGIYLR